MELPVAFFSLSAQNFSLKKILKKTCSEKISYIFSKKSFSNFQETELSYIFLNKVFPTFWERYVQYPGIFKTQNIFRILPNISDRMICKSSYLRHFLSPSSKNKKNPFWNKFLCFLIFQEMELSGSNITKFLIFAQKKAWKILYTSGNGNPKKLLTFQKVTFWAQKK